MSNILTFPIIYKNNRRNTRLLTYSTRLKVRITLFYLYLNNVKIFVSLKIIIQYIIFTEKEI